MKVYRAKEEIIFTGPYYKIIKEGELLYQDGEGYLAASGFYPVRKEAVESDTDRFELLHDDVHDANYYLKRIYTQYEMDESLKNKLHEDVTNP